MTNGPVAPDPAWDEAYLRVESYLRAHQIESRILLNELAADIIREARQRARSRAGLEPTSTALQVANERMAAWFDQMLGGESQSRERIGVRGRLALVMADVPGRWPHYFLRRDAVAPEMVEAMRAAYLEAGPELQFSNMAPRPIDLGPIANVAGETWRTFLRWPMLRAIAGWLIIVGLLGATWVLTR
ncbi:MAG TPA: hypothetical protein VHF69_00915 [Candidatus Synoicihabitans sp.]|nr:hypothetical protein [Candidatus Synoicihabitans sp.]